MRSPGCTMATPMKPLVAPTVVGVSMARRSPPRRRLGCDLAEIHDAWAVCGHDVPPRHVLRRHEGGAGRGPAGRRSGVGRAAVGDEVHAGDREEARELLSFGAGRPSERSAVEQRRQLGRLAGVRETERQGRGRCRARRARRRAGPRRRRAGRSCCAATGPRGSSAAASSCRASSSASAMPQPFRAG